MNLSSNEANTQQQYPPTSEQKFREELRLTLDNAHLDATQPIHIKMGRDVVFKGSLDHPDKNKLNPSRLAILEAVLDSAASGEPSVLAQRGVIQITVGNETVLRLNQGQVETNALQPIRVEQAAAQTLDYTQTLTTVADQLNEQLGSQLQTTIQAKGISSDFSRHEDDLEHYQEAFLTTTDWLTAQAGLSDLMQMYPNYPVVQEIARQLLDRQFNLDVEPESEAPKGPEAAESTESSPISPSEESLLHPAPSSFATLPLAPLDPVIAGQELREFDRRLNHQPPPTPLQALAENIKDQVTALQQNLMEQVPHGIPEKLTLPAAAVALKKLYQSDLSSAAQHWTGKALKKLHQVAGLVADDLTQKSMQATEKAISKVASMPQELKKRQMAQAVVKLNRVFGEWQGERQFGVNCENYQIRVTQNHYQVTNSVGKEILRFEQGKFGPKFSTYRPNVLEQADLLRTGKQLDPDLKQQSAEVIALKLGNLAPAGTRQEAHQQQEQRIVARISRMMERAAAKGQNKVTGKHYRVEQSADGSYCLTPHGAREPTLVISANGHVKNFLPADDRARLSQPSQPQKSRQCKTPEEVEF